MDASARSTSARTVSYRDFIRRVTNRDARFEPMKKAPGSKSLVLGEWVEECEDAAAD